MKMGLNGCEDHFSSLGYRLVPWLSWEEWNFVREALFSSSPESISMALNRIIAWQSRGCLPVSVEITAAIKDIQQRDPFFRNGLVAEYAFSEEALRMSYSMAITRLLNGVVDQSDKRQKRSINDSAEEIGLPRLLVDIRHESAHNRLPALPLLRLASKKALNWLNFNYWEPQKYEFPNIRPEIRSRLYMFARDTKRKQSTRAAGLQLEIHSLNKQNKANLKRLVKFCTAYPAELVSVLLEDCILKEVDLKDKFKPVLSNALQEDIVLDDYESSQLSRENWKSVVDAIYRRKPEIRTMLIKAAVEMITAIEVNEFEQGKLDSLNKLKVPSELKTLPGLQHPHTQELVFWVTWLLVDLESLGKAVPGVCNTTDTYTSFWHGPVSKGFLQALLVECLQSLAYTCALSEPVLIIAKLIGNKSLLCKLEYLVNLQKFDQERQNCAAYSLDQNSTCNIVGQEMMGNKEIVGTKIFNILMVETDIESCTADKHNSLSYKHDNRDFQPTFARQAVSLEQATQQVESLKKLHAKSIDKTVSENIFLVRKVDGEPSAQEGTWSIVKSWKPCAIGMLPSLSNSRGVLPVLECAQNDLGSNEVLVNDRRQEQQPNVQCMSLTVSPRTRMEENEQRNPNKHTEQPAFLAKVVTGVHKHVSDVREDNYDDAPDHQNVKKPRKEQHKDFSDGNSSLRSSSFLKFQPHSGIQGQLLSDGGFKPCGSEEFKVVQSAVHIFESFRH